MPAAAHAQDGATLFKTYCATCYEAGDSRAPNREILGQLSPEQILQALEGCNESTGGRAEPRALAEYLSGKPFSTE